jgi:hypothetical protein
MNRLMNLFIVALAPCFLLVYLLLATPQPMPAQVWERINQLDTSALRVAAITATADGQMFVLTTTGTYLPSNLRHHPRLDSQFTGIYAATPDGNLFVLNNTFVQYQTPIPSRWQTLSVAGPANTVLYRGASASTTLPLLPLVRGLGVTIFSQDSTLRAFVPTRLVRVVEDGIGVVSNAVTGLPFTLGFARVVMSSTGTLYITDDVFRRFFIYRSQDFGATWETLPSVGRYAQELAVSPRTGTLLMGGKNTQPFARSTDAGQTWKRVQGIPMRPSGTGVASFAFPKNAVVVNIRRVGIFRSVDDGMSFTSISEGLQGSDGGAFDVFRIAVAPNDSLYALVGDARGRGVYRSGNGGVSWSRINAGLPVSAANDTFTPLTIGFDSISTAYLGTTQGVFRLAEIRVSVNEGKNVFTPAMTIAPNPAQELASVRYTLAEPANVSIELWSLLGERVVSIAQGLQGAGAHECLLDVRGVACGVYRCCVNVGGRVEAVPLVVVR